MTTQYTLVQLADLITELCDPHHHVERIPYWDNNRNRKTREHRTIQPGLLQQLRDQLEPGANTATSGSSGYASRPPVATEALSRYMQISDAVHRWAWSLRLQPRTDLDSQCRALIGAAATLDPDTLGTLLTEARRWRNWAAVVTGWDTPPFHPRVPCPIDTCGKVTGLRVNLEAQSALCSACGSTWDGADGSITVLANYIRSTTDTPTEQAGSSNNAA